MWVGYSNDYVFLKQDISDGHALEVVTLEKGKDPDPHGMDMYQGKMYYCDAGIAPPGVLTTAGASYIYTIDCKRSLLVPRFGQTRRLGQSHPQFGSCPAKV